MTASPSAPSGGFVSVRPPPNLDIAVMHADVIGASASHLDRQIGAMASACWASDVVLIQEMTATAMCRVVPAIERRGLRHVYVPYGTDISDHAGLMVAYRGTLLSVDQTPPDFQPPTWRTLWSRPARPEVQVVVLEISGRIIRIAQHRLPASVSGGGATERYLQSVVPGMKEKRVDLVVVGNVALGHTASAPPTAPFENAAMFAATYPPPFDQWHITANVNRLVVLGYEPGGAAGSVVIQCRVRPDEPPDSPK